VGRWDDDEFAFVLVMESPAELTARCDAIAKVISLQDCKVGEKRFPLGCSGGVTMLGIPKESASVEEPLAAARAFMKKAKSSGKNQCLRLNSSRSAA
jgi:PleD family two-component response regulator